MAIRIQSGDLTSVRKGKRGEQVYVGERKGVGRTSNIEKPRTREDVSDLPQSSVSDSNTSMVPLDTHLLILMQMPRLRIGSAPKNSQSRRNLREHSLVEEPFDFLIVCFTETLTGDVDGVSLRW